MPLFKSQHTEPPATTETNNRRVSSDGESPQRKGTLFGRRRSVSPAHDDTANTANGNGTRNGGFFSSGRRSTDDTNSVTSSRTGGGGNFFGGFGGNGNNNEFGRDPSILAAKQKVSDAESAEKEADRALHQARMSVKEAKEHVKILEREAEEDARRAKAKQQQSKMITKSAAGLGRHG